MAILLGILSAAVALGAFLLSRDDLTRPAGLFAMTFFAFVALAQLRLTSFETTWTAGQAAVILGGGLAFAGTATVAAGWRPVRGSISLDVARYAPARLVWIAIVLLAGAVAGLIYKASILGGVPLLSDDPDVVRLRAYGSAGDVAVPAWSTFLTNGFYLALWCLLAAVGLRRRASRMWTGAVCLLAIAALAGAAAEGSRNIVLFALVVPVVVAYVLIPRWSPRQRLAAGMVALVLVAGVAGAFLLRTGHGATRGFVDREVQSQPALVRPVIPLYMAGVYSLETLRRLMGSVPEQMRYERGTASLQALPDAFFPQGKYGYTAELTFLTHKLPDDPTWTVASYQGRPLADFGPAGVIGVSVLLGLLLGGGWRACRDRQTLLAAVGVGYVAYMAAFLVYENLLSVGLAAVYDLALLALIERFVRGRPASR